MATVTNTTNDNLGFPGAAGAEISIEAGATIEIDDATAATLHGHPLLALDEATAAALTAAAEREAAEESKPKRSRKGPDTTAEENS